MISIYLLEFISSSLEPNIYLHDLFVQDYLRFLEDHGVIVDKDMHSRFYGEIYRAHEIVFNNWAEIRNYGYEKYKQIKRANVESYFSTYKLSDAKQFLEYCMVINESIFVTKKAYDLGNGILDALITLSDVNSSLFIELIMYYLEAGEKLGLYPTPLVRKMIDICGAEQTYQILEKFSYPSKIKWILGYYQTLPVEQIGANDPVELLKFYQQAKPEELPQNLDYLLKYQGIYPEIIVDITKIVLEKGDLIYCPFILAFLTNPHAEVNKNLINLFANDIGLLKKVYFFVVQNGQFDDYDASTLLKILAVQPDFMSEYINHMYSQGNGRAAWGHYDPDFSILWLQDNYVQIMEKVINDIYRLEKYHDFTDLRRFFLPRDSEPQNQLILERQDFILQDLLKEKINDIDFVSFIFDMASSFSSERRIKLLSQFLSNNKNLDDFKELQIEPIMRSWSGSEVPVIQERIDYFERILSLLNSVDLLPHRNYIELRIQGLRNHLRLTMKKEFLED